MTLSDICGSRPKHRSGPSWSFMKFGLCRPSVHNGDIVVSPFNTGYWFLSPECQKSLRHSTLLPVCTGLYTRFSCECPVNKPVASLSFHRVHLSSCLVLPLRCPCMIILTGQICCWLARVWVISPTPAADDWPLPPRSSAARFPSSQGLVSTSWRLW